MCRLAAYLGPPISLKRFLFDPSHSLIKQSWAPREMEEAVLNADGFGIGWYTDQQKPVTYLNTHPIWSDSNLPSLASSLNCKTWLACVRSATPGQMTGLVNTQPFVNDPLLFMHNGYIKDFNPDYRIIFHDVLKGEIQAGISGHTDSEYLFALLRQQILQQPEADLVTQLTRFLDQIPKLIGQGTMLLNIIISDGSSIYAIRHALDGQSPSLYFAVNAELFSDAVIVASEQLTGNNCWQVVPDHSLLVFSNTAEPEIISL
jgi:gamma-glutamyl hercynylcysteine S-oxide hydrolase